MTSAAIKESYCPACDRSFPSTSQLCPSDGTRLVRIGDDPLLHRTLDGRFRLDERIGSGGMGAVYRATQLSVGRAVAVKVIRSQSAVDESAIKRFLREAQLSSRLNHPHIVSIIDFGQTDDNLLYLVMELCTGRSLNVLLDEEAPLPVGRAIQIAIQICDGLAAAHRQEIIHRDLKPSNVMELDEHEELVKILDFGLARSLSGDHSTITRSDVILGTPTHMAPEAVRGLYFDSRSDLYALGVILYTMLCGRVPFEADTIQLLLAQQVAAPVPPLPPSVPLVLARIVEKLLEKEPEARYQTAQMLKEALLAVRGQLGVAELGQRAPLPRARPEPSRNLSAMGPTAELSADQVTGQRAVPAASAPSQPASAALPASAASPPPLRRASRGWLLAAVPIVAVAAWFATRGGFPPAAAPVSQPVAVPVPVAMPQPSPPPPQPSPSPSPSPSQPSPSPPSVTFDLRGKRGVRVLRDGQPVGALPLRYTTERSSTPFTLRFVDGKRSKTEQLLPDADQTIEIKWSPRRGPGALSPPESPKPTYDFVR